VANSLYPVHQKRVLIKDKKISEFIHRARKNKILDEKLRSAISKGINEKVTKKKMKMNVAGLISYVTMRSGNKFKESEIRELFDAIAKDKGECDIDTDIPDSPESFAKAIQRERRNWGNALNNSRSFT
jgi:predicted hydrocarbon binding protein